MPPPRSSLPLKPMREPEPTPLPMFCWLPAAPPRSSTRPASATPYTVTLDCACATADTKPSANALITYFCIFQSPLVISSRAHRGDDRLFHFFFQSTFPLGDHGGRDGVADRVGGGAAHVQELVDAHQQQQARFRNVELVQRGGDHHQRGARHAGDALGGHHQD